MERLFKVKNVYRTEIPGKNPGDANRPKVEITLCYHETFYSSQSGPGIRHQYVQASLLDDAANNCQLQAGMWVVASISQAGFESRNEPGRMIQQNYLDRCVPVTDWNIL